MKLTLLLKTIGILSLIAALSTVVGTSIQQNVKAQTQEGTESSATVPTASQVDEKVCLAAYPQDQVREDGTASFDDFQGLALSPNQIEELNKIDAATSETYSRIVASGVRVADPDSTVEYEPIVGTLEDMPPEIERPIIKRRGALIETTMDAIEIAAVMNAEFGQYAEFGPGTKIIYTPEQEAALKANTQNFDTRFFAILTPEQQQKLQENKGISSEIREACGIPEYSSTTTFYGFDPDFDPNVAN